MVHGAPNGSALSSASVLSGLDAKLIDLLPAAVYVCEASSGTLIRYNRRAVELWGREPQPGDTEERFCGAHRLFQTDGTPMSHGRTPMAEVLRTGVSVRDQEVVIERPDGSRITALVNVEAIRGEGGTIAGAVNVFQDISERKQAEERLHHNALWFRRLLDKLPTAAYTCDRDGRITYFNEPARKMWGRVPKLNDPEDRFCGSFKLYSVDGSPLRHACCWMALALETNQEHAGREIIIGRPDGTRVSALAYANPISDEAGNLLGAINILVDITDRKRTENELRDARTRLEAAIDAGAISTWTWDIPSNSLYANQTMARLFSVPSAGASGAPLENYVRAIHPDDWPRVSAALSASVESGVEYEAEYRIQQPDGSDRWVVARGRVEQDETGRPVRMPGVMIDITERKRLEEEQRRLLEELDAERERLVEVFQRSPAFMAVLRGPNHRFERANERYYDLVGNRDILGKTVREALPEIEGQDYFEILDQVYRSGEPFQGTDMQVLFRNKLDGPLEEHSLEFVYEPLRAADGSVSGVLAHGVDLTDRKRAEEDLARVTAESERRRRLYETILSATPDFVYVFDLDHRFTYANESLLNMWGRGWEESIGKTCHELGYEPWHADMHAREIDQVIATKQPVRGEVPFTGTNGRRIYDYIFVPVFGADGEVEAVAGTTRDVTARKNLEQELQQRAQELAASDRKKDEFIALLAHELRNPLAPIRNGLQVMRLAANDPTTVAEVRSMMDRQVGHMVRLIDDLLDVSRLTRNKLHLQKSRVLLADVVGSAVETARPAIEAAEHRLVVSLPSDPIFLHADLTRLAQVFSNLLSNSAKYTKPGGCISFTAQRQDSEIVVSVTDTGIGIPADALPDIFEMFSQVDSSIERSNGGLGIGLALVKGLVEMHGGTITAESDGPDRGSTLTVRLPLLSSPRTERPSRSSSQGDVRGTGIQSRILVVDDNRDSCQSMALMLRKLGHEVDTAYDGLRAVTAAESFRPGIILMDIGMPGLNGYEATRHIRQRPWGKDVIIVAITGWGQESDRSESKAAGCDGHLVKPINLSDLEQLLTTLRGSVG